ALRPGRPPPPPSPAGVVLTPPVTWDRTAMTFQIPVTIRTANAGQATWLKRRAAARGISAPDMRKTGTSAASGICPPAQTVAASTCGDSRGGSQERLGMALRPCELTLGTGTLLVADGAGSGGAVMTWRGRER